MSSEDIRAGARWSQAIAQQLEGSDFGIICENLSAPWLYFEAGAITKKVSDARVVPYLLGVTESQVTGPLSQFQMKCVDKEPTRELLQSINNSLQEPIDAVKLDLAFDKWWPDLKKALATIRPPDETIPSPRPVEEVVEEILGVVRGLARERHTDGPTLEEMLLLVRQLEQARRLAADLRLHFHDLEARTRSSNPDPEAEPVLNDLAERLARAEELERRVTEQLKIGIGLMRPPVSTGRGVEPGGAAAPSWARTR